MARILIVEDDALIAKIYDTRLRSEGHEIFWADDCQKAKELVAKEKFDLYLLDLMIPKGSGFKVLEAIKKKNKKTPVLIYSNFSKEEEIAKAKQMGAAEFLVKAELTPSQVVDKIKTYLPK